MHCATVRPCYICASVHPINLMLPNFPLSRTKILNVGYVGRAQYVRTTHAAAFKLSQNLFIKHSKNQFKTFRRNNVCKAVWRAYYDCAFSQSQLVLYTLRTYYNTHMRLDAQTINTNEENACFQPSSIYLILFSVCAVHCIYTLTPMDKCDLQRYKHIHTVTYT